MIGMNDQELGYWVQRCVTGVRKKDGAAYPSETLYALVCGIQRYSTGHHAPPFLVLILEVLGPA